MRKFIIILLYALAIIGVLVVVYFFGIAVGGCSYKVHFNPEAKTIESKAKGKYEYKDKNVEMKADFGKPLINIGTPPKIQYEN